MGASSFRHSVFPETVQERLVYSTPNELWSASNSAASAANEAGKAASVCKLVQGTLTVSGTAPLLARNVPEVPPRPSKQPLDQAVRVSTLANELAWVSTQVGLRIQHQQHHEELRG